MADVRDRMECRGAGATAPAVAENWVTHDLEGSFRDWIPPRRRDDENQGDHAEETAHKREFSETWDFKPRTEIAMVLWEIQQRAIQAGRVETMTEQEFDAHLKEMRGENQDEFES